MSFDSNLISIVIPTYKRPGALIRLLTSIDGSKVENFNIEIIVADNDPAASANEVMTRFMKNNLSPITHIHVPEPGVSNARNGALKAAKGRYILFIDDDMEADLDWAQTLAHGALALDATLAFGPAIAVMPADDNPIFDYMQPLFCRVRDYPTGLIDEGIATGNCFLDRAKEALPNPVFDPALNHSGGVWRRPTNSRKLEFVYTQRPSILRSPEVRQDLYPPLVGLDLAPKRNSVSRHSPM